MRARYHWASALSRYKGFLKELIAQRMALARVVDSVAPTEYYPDFLLSDGAMPNERMEGAEAILRGGVFTRATAAKLAALPEAVMGKTCPAERTYRSPNLERPPLDAAFGVQPARRDQLAAERVPFEAARALDLALEHCEPRSRAAFARHIGEFTRMAMRGKPRRSSAAGDDAVLVQLQSARRPEMAAGLKRAILLPAITDELVRVAQAAAGRLFEEQCPVSPYATQLEAYRAAEKAAAEEAARVAAERAAAGKR